MAVITSQVVAAAASHIVARQALLNDLRGFSTAVHEGLDLRVKFQPREQTEKHYGGDEVVLLSSKYEFAGWRTQVALTFYIMVGAKSLRSVWMEVAFYCVHPDMLKRVRRRGLLNQVDARKRFGPRAECDLSDSVWVGEKIPRSVWLTNDPKASEVAIRYTRKVLERYLREVKKLVR